MSEILFDIDKVSLLYNEETNAIELIWKKIQDSATYRLVFTKAIEFFREKKATCWLADIRKEGVVGVDDTKWLQTEIVPKGLSYGLKKIAIVMDKDVFKQFYMKNLQKDMKEKGHELMNYFDSIEAANQWLKEG